MKDAVPMGRRFCFSRKKSLPHARAHEQGDAGQSGNQGRAVRRPMEWYTKPICRIRSGL